MAISLQKGQKISLSKEDGTQLTQLMVGLGWQPGQPQQSKGGLKSLFKSAPNVNVDIDSSVVLLGENGRVSGKQDVVYFAHKKHASGSVIHLGDNLTGGAGVGGMSDSEQINLDLTLVPAGISRIVFVVNIYECVSRKQHFGMVQNAYIRIVDKTSNETIASYNLTEDYAGKTSMIVGEIYRHNGTWKFNALGQAGTARTLTEIIQSY